MTAATSPYARTLGLTRNEDGARIILSMPWIDTLMGRPGFLHGGAIAGLLENAAWANVFAALGCADDSGGATLKPIAITVDFLRGGKAEETHASARIVRLGRRVAVVHAYAWQEDEGKPIASADLKLLVVRGSGAG
jgi:uncharacterized protein (TIGR00369 family)